MSSRKYNRMQTALNSRAKIEMDARAFPSVNESRAYINVYIRVNAEKSVALALLHYQKHDHALRLIK